MYTEPAFSSTAQHDQSPLVSSIILSLENLLLLA